LISHPMESRCCSGWWLADLRSWEVLHQWPFPCSVIACHKPRHSSTPGNSRGSRVGSWCKASSHVKRLIGWMWSPLQPMAAGEMVKWGYSGDGPRLRAAWSGYTCECVLFHNTDGSKSLGRRFFINLQLRPTLRLSWFSSVPSDLLSLPDTPSSLLPFFLPYCSRSWLRL
jgi:hypothetical protein